MDIIDIFPSMTRSKVIRGNKKKARKRRKEKKKKKQNNK
jgi:hypothetical protein